MDLTLEKIISYEESDFKEGQPWYGFHDRMGNRFICSYFKDYIGFIQKGKMVWTLGRINPHLAPTHYEVEIYTPKYINKMYHEEAYIISESNYAYKLDYSTMKMSKLIDYQGSGIQDAGCAVCDLEDHIWVNDVRGSKLFHFDPQGKLIETIGKNEVGFNKGTVSFDEVMFNWSYDLRLGPDGNLYLLDSKNYAVRKINIKDRTVTTVIGDGKSGRITDESDPNQVRLGGNSGEYFDGPWSIILDEEGNLFVGDTYNKAIRILEKDTGKVCTLVENSEQEYYHIAGMDYYKGKLYVPNYVGNQYSLTILDKLMD